jgi:hypothetical protein
MATHKRIEITIQTRQVVTIRSQNSIRLWCPECGCEVEVVDADQAESLGNMTGRLGDGTGAGKPHRLNGIEGMTVICLPSLLKAT